MKFVLALSVLIVTVSSAVKREFNCTVVQEKNGQEMDWDGVGDPNKGSFFDWNKEVSYFFDGIVSDDDKALIRNQMDVIEEKTCVKFTEISQNSELKRLKIVVGQGSCGDWSIHRFSAHVKYGYRMGEEMLLESRFRLTDHPACKGDPMYTGGILHELMHALGAIHTHQRMDRDDYIDYHGECAVSGAHAQFDKVSFNLPSEDLPYEYNSIMHYRCDTFSTCMGDPRCECPTMIPRSGDCSQLGSKEATSKDWKMINQYHCIGNNNNNNERTTQKSGVTGDCPYGRDYSDCGSDKSICPEYAHLCPALCKC